MGYMNIYKPSEVRRLIIGLPHCLTNNNQTWIKLGWLLRSLEPEDLSVDTTGLCWPPNPETDVGPQAENRGHCAGKYSRHSRFGRARAGNFASLPKDVELLANT